MSSTVQNIARELASASIRTVVVDRSGLIVAANDEWFAFAECEGLATPNAGIGKDYVGFCIGEDGKRVKRKLGRLLGGEIDSFLHHYECGPRNKPEPFVMLASRSKEGSGQMFILAHMSLMSASSMGLTATEPEANKSIDEFTKQSSRSLHSALEFKAALDPLLNSLDELRLAYAAVRDGVDPTVEKEIRQLMPRIAQLIDKVSRRN